MEKQESINFNKARDFGDILGDTFKFLKLEFKPFLRVLLTYVLPFLIIAGLLSAWYQTTIYDDMLNVRDMNNPFSIYGKIFNYKYFLVIIASMISYTIVMAATYSYIKLYVTEGKDGFTPEDVWRLIGRKFFPILGTNIVLGIIITIGFVFCIVPGVYAMVVFALLIPAIVFEDLPMGDAMGRSTFLVKEHFWFTLGIGFVTILIAGIAAYIFMIPQLILSIFTTFTTISTGESSTTYDILLTIFTVIGTVGASILYAIPYAALGLHYYSQIEKKESPNLINKIEQINQPEDDNNTGIQY